MVLWNGQRLVERKLKIQCVSTVFHICKGIANMYVDFLSHIQIIGLKVASGCTAAQPSGAELPTGSGAAESDRKQVVGSRFKRAERRWPRREPAPCSPSSAASRTTVRPTSLTGGLAACSRLASNLETRPQCMQFANRAKKKLPRLAARQLIS